MSNELAGMFTQYWIYLAVRAACRLNLFDAISHNPITESNLCKHLGTNSKATHHLIRALAHHGFLLLEDDLVALTELSKPLCENHPEHVKYACLLWGGEHMDVWQNLDVTVRTGEPVFEALFSEPFFDYLGGNPAVAREYHKAMFEYARDDYRGIELVIDLRVSTSILDVGGANGALVRQLQKANPQKAFSILDREVNPDDMQAGIDYLVGDFFDEIPAISDCILLSRVIHDWDDNRALTILRNCYCALPKGAVLYLIENDTARLGDGGHLLSLNMLAICRSYERSKNQYQELLTKSGFMINEITGHGKHIIIKANRP